jgi:NADH:ubiquinone oxidoreductase subunit 3 (subunit A)
MENLLLSPPVAMSVFLALAYGLYRLSGALSAPGQEHHGKHQPYACGEDLLPQKVQLTYRAFFWLALMFGILHLATLVVSTLPLGVTSHRIAVVYLVGIGISVLVLTKGVL